GERPAIHKLPAGSNFITLTSSPGTPVVLGLTMLNCGRVCAPALAQNTVNMTRLNNRAYFMQFFLRYCASVLIVVRTWELSLSVVSDVLGSFCEIRIVFIIFSPEC